MFLIYSYQVKSVFTVTPSFIMFPLAKLRPSSVVCVPIFKMGQVLGPAMIDGRMVLCIVMSTSKDVHQYEIKWWNHHAGHSKWSLYFKCVCHHHCIPFFDHPKKTTSLKTLYARCWSALRSFSSLAWSRSKSYSSKRRAKWKRSTSGFFPQSASLRHAHW